MRGRPRSSSPSPSASAPTVEVVKDGQSVPARSIMGLMMLGAGLGASIELRAEGWDAKEALEALTDLIESGFNEQD